MSKVSITVLGNLTATPELRYTQGGVPVASFSVASNERYLDKETGQWQDGETTFLRCSAWRGLGENIAASLDKGDAVQIRGRLTQRSYEKDGEKRISYEVEVTDLGASLQFARAVVERVRIAPPAPFGYPAAQVA